MTIDLVKPLISVICPNFNGADLLYETTPLLLESLKKTPYLCELIYIDNGSTDESRSFLVEQRQVRNYFFSENMGFSVASNQGAAIARGKYLFFINNDMIPQGEFLSPLIKMMERDDSYFAVGPLVTKWNSEEIDDGMREPLFHSGLLETPLSQKSFSEEGEMTFFCGGAALIRKDRFFALGGFDEIYSPFAWEDLDLGYRAVKKGWLNGFTPKARIYHRREATSRKAFKPFLWKAYVWRNKFIFMWSHLHSQKIFLSHVAWLPIKLIKFLFNGRWPYFLGFLMAFKNLFYIIRKRNLLKKEAKLRDENFLIEP